VGARRSQGRANAVTVDVKPHRVSGCGGSGCPSAQARAADPSRNGRKADAEVVWRSHEAWDAGFELVKPDASFWGLK